jgi:hypothetical protein
MEKRHHPASFTELSSHSSTPQPMKMKFPQILPLLALSLSATTQSTSLSLTDHNAIISTTLQFYRSLDLKSPSLLRSATTPNITFDGSLFVSIGLGLPEPLVGQDVVVPALVGALPMTTMHTLANFYVEVEGEEVGEEEGGVRAGGGRRANVSAYVLAYHYKQVEEPRENPRNNFLMGNRFEGRVVKGDGDGMWRLEAVRLEPFFQSGTIEVMGLGGGGDGSGNGTGNGNGGL